MAILALAAWALQQQIRLFLSVAKLPKKQSQLSSIKNSDNGYAFFGFLSTATTNKDLPWFLG
jgi:hypothetical protein